MEPEPQNTQIERVDSSKEQKWITSSQVYHDVKKALKVVAYGIGAILLIYVLFRAFSFWFFVGLILAAIPLGYLIIKITKVPSTLVLSMHIAEDEDDLDYFSIYGIPDHMLEQFDRTGGDFYYLTTLDGAKIAVCDSIDFEGWKIKSPWFAELSNFEFFRTKKAFKLLQDMYVTEVKENSYYRSLHSALVMKHVGTELKKHYDKFDKVMLEPDTDDETKILEVVHESTDSTTSDQPA